MNPFFNSRGSSFHGGRGGHGRHGGPGGRHGGWGEGHGPHEARAHISGADIFGGGGGGRGARRERVFEPGDLKLLALHILGQQPSHGYELIRAVGDLVGGDYSPSPGTIYPTLNLLEDLGLIAASAQEGGRKQYSLTPEGQSQLTEQRAAVEQLLARLGQVKQRHQARRIPEIQRAMENLKTALRLRLGDSADTPDTAEIQRVADLIDRAAVEIGRR